MSFIGLDIETAPREGYPQEYALQPWRLGEGSAEITSTALDDGPESLLITHVDTEEHLREVLDASSGTFVTWNGIFDIAWLHALGVPVADYEWLDGMLLWKWLVNGQQTVAEKGWSWSLKSAVKWYRQHAILNREQRMECEHFIELKGNEPPAGEDDEYWEERCRLDAKYTRLICELIWERLTPQQRQSARIEAKCLVPFAKSWVRGILLDVEGAAAAAPALTLEMYQIEEKLQLLNYGDKEWAPSRILRSPKQKCTLLYQTWGLTPKFYNDVTDTQKAKALKDGAPVPTQGAPGTDKKSLTYLADKDERCLDLLRWSVLNTQYTKFICGIEKCSSYLDSDTCHPAPRLFSTKTGRVTYSSKSGKQPVGVAIHQTPRPKEIRKLYLPPKDHWLIEFDASGQEARFMSLKADDETMQQVFKDDKDFHSVTGAAIGNIQYSDFMDGLHRKEEQFAGPRGLRYQGKFTNLSEQYRISIRTLRIKARVDYGLDVPWDVARLWHTTYHNKFVGVQYYWDKAITEAQRVGYAETWAGRRYYLDEWNVDDRRWATESNAINHPIQGAGADQKELAIACLRKQVPELEFGFDLHDGLFYYLPVLLGIDRCLAILRRGKAVLDNLPYQSAWGWTPEIPLPWDAAYGPNWGDMEKVI